uniref:Lipase (Class 3) n=1 Tax=Candidatus Kentrum sp. UNK TaxID=2126344 RepID=A0A451AX46_9GAMM|nr:MAG: Lipase (class 3) [Candidatus Kentron sp. UNK]VFK70619.1 MAG: Lipase (class 3) [Candidatus Kentron sp. UNK]
MKTIRFAWVTGTVITMLLSVNAGAREVEIYPRQSGKAVMNSGDAADLALKYVAVADAAYDPDKGSYGGWKRVENATDLFKGTFLGSVDEKVKAFFSGFKAGVYEQNGEYVLAFAGTDGLAAPGDVYTNAKSGLGFPTDQYTLAVQAAKLAKKKYPNIKMVGHSLGGGLAQHAALNTKTKGVVFNAKGSSFVHFYRPTIGDDLIAFNVGYDFAANSGNQLGTEYIIDAPGKNWGGFRDHSLERVKKALQQAKAKKPKGKAVDWARVRLTQRAAVAVISGNVSHVGSPAGSGGIGGTKNYDTGTTNYNTGREGLFISASPLAETEWRLVSGNPSLHLGKHNSYGSIPSPEAGGTIFSVNNAGVTKTVIQKQFVLPANKNRFSFSTSANFVTTEFPEYVGKGFNDTGKIFVTTPAGKTLKLQTIYSKSVDASKFSHVSGLPAPMVKGTGKNTGGHTGFAPVSVNNLKVAKGGTVSVRIETENVGDTLYPSAVLINKASAR